MPAGKQVSHGNPIPDESMLFAKWNPFTLNIFDDVKVAILGKDTIVKTRIIDLVALCEVEIALWCIDEVNVCLAARVELIVSFFEEADATNR